MSGIWAKGRAEIRLLAVPEMSVGGNEPRSVSAVVVVE